MKITYKKGIRLRLYPTYEVKQFIRQSEGNKRFVWNRLLKQLDKEFDEHKNDPTYHFPSKFDLVKRVRILKQEHKFLYLSDASSLQHVAETLHDAFVAFFKKEKGRPQIKYRQYNGSFTMKCLNNNIRSISPHYWKLPKIKELVKVSNQRVEGTIKRVTISFTASGQYYLTVLVECESQAFPETGDNIGIDLGLTDFVTLSNGIKEKMPKFHNKYKGKRLMWERRCARRRKLAKKRLGDDWRSAKNYQKARRMVAKYRQKEANQRKDFLQKLSTYLVKAYDVIVIEDIKSSNLMKNHTLAEAIMRSAWRMFRDMLTYKCEWYGKTLKIVNPSYTSQQCSICKSFEGKKGLHIREWQCTQCQTIHDRDINAAVNILNKGLTA